MRTISNGTRGCGTLKQGGFYARSDFSPGGMLQMAWCFGAGLLDGLNIHLDIAPRGMTIVNLPLTLLSGGLQQTSDSISDEVAAEFPALANLPLVGVVDHVGRDHYAPLDFVAECLAMGISRRITPALAKQLAGKTVPILFTHADIPILPGNQPPAEYGTALEYAPSYYNPDWGLYRANDGGRNHWLLAFLHALADDPKLLGEGAMYEQPFFIGWITNVVYVMAAGDDQKALHDIELSGIEVVTLKEAHV